MTHGHDTGLLSSTTPCTTAPGRVAIGHVQLRDVLICPHDQGLVTYPEKTTIVEHDVTLPPTSKPRRLAELSFTPVSLSALILPGTNDTLLAAGGQEAELHLSYYSGSSLHPDGRYRRGAARGFGSREWEWKTDMSGASINNSVLLSSLSLTGSHESSAEPRVVVSNNDETVKFFDVAVRRDASEHDDLSRLVSRGELRLDVAVNHSSISPDGRTLLCVGDSPDVYLHRITGGSRMTFSPVARLSLAPYLDLSSYAHYATPHVPASFSTAFSSDGTKFAVASQEGVVAVWDVRSSKPLKIFGTDKTRTSRAPFGLPSGRISLDPYLDWTRAGGRAPGWGVRAVKFSPRGVGREVMTFTEHTNLLHVVDARTFETEEIVRVPYIDLPPQPPPGRRSSSPSRPHSPLDPAPTPYPSAASSQPQPHTHQPRVVLFSDALGDTFRIPSSSADTTRWTRHTGRDLRRGAEDDLEGIFVIPQLGDRQMENNIRRLLSSHTSRSIVLGREVNPREDEPEPADEMDVDELESDCFSPSRTPSPPPSARPSDPPWTQAVASSSSLPLPASSSTNRLPETLRVQRPSLLARRESSGPYAPRAPSIRTGVTRRHRRSQADAPPEMDLDIAGTCFDPSGSFIYVASTRGIAEWKVRGAEQRWWSESTWL